MKHSWWKVKLKVKARSIGYCFVGFLLCVGVTGQRPQNQDRPNVGFQTFPVPQSFQQLRIFTPTGSRDGRNENLRVNQFSHQFFHPVPAPSNQVDQRLTPSARPNSQGDRPPPLGREVNQVDPRFPQAARPAVVGRGATEFVPSRIDPTRKGAERIGGRSIPAQEFTSETASPRKFPDFSAAPFRPEPAGRKILSPDSANTIRPSERTKPVEDVTKFSVLPNKKPTPEEEFFSRINSDFDKTADFFEKAFSKPSVRPIDSLPVGTRPKSEGTTERDRNTSKGKLVVPVPSVEVTTTSVPEEEDYYVYYDEDDLPEELRKLLQEDANQPLVVERITTELKPTTFRQQLAPQAPSTVRPRVAPSIPEKPIGSTVPDRPTGSRIFPGTQNSFRGLTTTERFSIEAEKISLVRESTTRSSASGDESKELKKSVGKAEALLALPETENLQTLVEHELVLTTNETGEGSSSEEARSEEVSKSEVEPEKQRKVESDSTIAVEPDETTEAETTTSEEVETTTFKKLSEITTVRGIPEITTVKEIPEITTVKEIPEITTIKEISETTVKEIPKITTIEEISETSTTKEILEITTIRELPDSIPKEVTTTEAIKEVPDTVAPLTDSRNPDSFLPRRPFKSNRLRPALSARRFPDRFSKLTFDDDSTGANGSSRPPTTQKEQTIVSVATTKSIVSTVTDSPSVLEIVPKSSADRDPKAIGGQKEPENALRKVKPANEADDIGDKLDKFQSDLSDSFLFGGSSPSFPPVNVSKPQFSYPKSPSEIIKDLKVGPPAEESDVIPVSEQVLTTQTTEKSVSVEANSFTTTENLVHQTKVEDSEKSVVNNLFNRVFGSAKTDNLDRVLPQDFENKSQLLTTAEVASPEIVTATGQASGNQLVSEPQPDSLSGLLPPGFKIEGLLPPGFTGGTTTTGRSIDSNPKELSPLAAFLPPGFKLDAVSEDPLAGLLPPGFGGLKIEPFKPDSLAGLLAPGFNPTVEKADSGPSEKAESGPADIFDDAALDDISKFLPKDFRANRFSSKQSSKPKPAVQQEQEEEPSKTRLVFPTRAGKHGTSATTAKPIHKTTTTEPIVFKTGWPVRSKAEFTGYPTPNTTARPRPTTEMTFSPIIIVETTTQRITTTTVYTPKVTASGICIHTCKVAASLRIVGGVNWSGELSNPITSEFRDLATLLKVQLDGVYRSSALAQFYRGVDIEGFSPGSVIVDYFVHLTLPSSQTALNATDIRTLFHQALNDGNEGLHFGNFTIDPRASSFVVQIADLSASAVGDEEDTSLFPSWAIAVIVIGLLSLLFVVTFGVTMLVRRRRVNQVKKAVPLSEDMLNELSKTGAGIENYAMEEDPYDLGPLPPDPWDDLSKLGRPRPPPARRPASSTGIPNRNVRNFNPGIYDSWKSEWNGQLASYASNHFSPGSSYSLSRDLISGSTLRKPDVPARPGSSLATRFNMVHDWGRGFTNTTLVNNYTSEWVAAAAGRNSRLGLEGGWSHSVLNGSNRSSAARTMRRPTDYDNEF